MKAPTSLWLFIKKHRFVILSTLFVFLGVYLIETFVFHHLFFGPDGRFGWWDNNIWG